MVDPFSKTSFDVLLDCLVDIDPNSNGADAAFTDDRGDAFPGFDSSANPGPSTGLSVAQNQAVAKLLSQQHEQQRAAMLQQQQQRRPAYPANVLGESATEVAFASPITTEPAPLPVPTTLPGHRGGLHLGVAGGAMSTSVAHPRKAASEAHRSSFSGRSEHSYTTGSEAGMEATGGRSLKRMSSVDGEDMYPTQRRASNMSDPGGTVPFPRSSLQMFGVSIPGAPAPNIKTCPKSPSHSEPDESAPHRRREKNRIAQRRFRERQKMTVAMLQTEVDGKQEEIDALHSQMMNMDHTNRMLARKLAAYERMFGPLPDAA
mmetsp:Transcript_10507/g.31549  ORF Transcript_10507/g.31549 Transcript_10507/m.31549 type:complete len:317 (-) Transcript_10507:596-1546(-)